MTGAFEGLGESCNVTALAYEGSAAVNHDKDTADSWTYRVVTDRLAGEPRASARPRGRERKKHGPREEKRR